MSQPKLDELANRALSIATDIAKKDGQPKAEIKVDVVRNASANVRFARNEVTTSGSSDEVTISLYIALGQKHASTSINQADDSSIRALAMRALQMAKLSPDDPEHMPLVGAQTYAKTPSAYDEATATMAPGDRAAIAARAIKQGDAAKVQIAGFFERGFEMKAIRSSSGLTASHEESSLHYTVTARTDDGTGSGWAGREASKTSELDDEALAKTAIDKGVKSAKPKPLAPGKYTVILEPQAVGEMLHFMVGQMDQRTADEGRSFFAKKAGEKLFADMVTLKSDPTDPLTPGAPFDPEGLALKPHVWIENGKVKDLYVSRYWGQKTNKPPTGSHASYVLAGGTAASIDELVKGTKRGLLVTRFWYNRMLEPQTIMITGLTRDGIFLVENGKVTGPVANFRYNESPVNVLKRVDAMTKETWRVISYGGHWRVPALRTHEFTMASPSAAV